MTYNADEKATAKTGFDASKQIAVGITFLISCAIVIWLMITKLSWNDFALVAGPKSEITMVELPEEEFMEVEVMPLPGGETDPSAPALTPEDIDNEAQPAPQTATDLHTQGVKGNPVQTVTQKQPSSVQEQQKPTSTKPAATVDNKKADEEKAAAARTRNAVNNAFANAGNRNNALNGTKDEGLAGSKAGNSAASSGPNAKGSSTGTVGGGWRMPVYSNTIPSNEVGSVTFEVAVNRDGSVGKITQISNKGLTSATIARCRAEIQRHRFTHGNPETAEAATARVTFTFQDPS